MARRCRPWWPGRSGPGGRKLIACSAHHRRSRRRASASRRRWRRFSTRSSAVVGLVGASEVELELGVSRATAQVHLAELLKRGLIELDLADGLLGRPENRYHIRGSTRGRIPNLGWMLGAFERTAVASVVGSNAPFDVGSKMRRSPVIKMTVFLGMAVLLAAGMPSSKKSSSGTPTAAASTAAPAAAPSSAAASGACAAGAAAPAR